tara:strand:- start:177 stop:317 length:141 start_codon:yes stop_codon:yes gene_type:complete
LKRKSKEKNKPIGVGLVLCASFGDVIGPSVGMTIALAINNINKNDN